MLLAISLRVLTKFVKESDTYFGAIQGSAGKPHRLKIIYQCLKEKPLKSRINFISVKNTDTSQKEIT